jgi:hypothetical protein
MSPRGEIADPRVANKNPAAYFVNRLRDRNLSVGKEQ